MIRRIDSLSHANALQAVSPMWKCGFAAAMFVLSYLLHPVLQLAVFAWMSLWTVGYARIALASYLTLFAVSCLFYITSVPALVLEVGSGAIAEPLPLWVLVADANWQLYVTSAGVDQAVDVFLRVAACSSCLFFVIFTTPVTDLMQVLKRVRCPQLVLELMLIMYRFLFLLADTADGMITAQRARGGYAGFSSKLRDTAVLIVRLFSKTIQRYKGLSQGLTARGYTDQIAFAPYRSQPVPLRYQMESYAGIAVLVLIECWIRWR